MAQNQRVEGDADVLYRSERSGEAAEVRQVVVDAFGDRKIGDVVDRLRSSPDWLPGPSLVAESDGHLLFTRGLLDAPQRLVHVLVLARSASRGTCRHGASARR